MNRHRQRELLNAVRTRVQMFHRESGVAKGFRAEKTSEGTEVYLYDFIGGYDGITAKDVVSTLAGIRGDFGLHINSGGGDIFEGVAIHNAVRNHNGRKTVYIDGIAASAASFVAMAGDEIVIEDNATMMIHDGWGFTIGDEQDHLDAAGVLGKLSDTIAGMYAQKAGGAKDDWRNLMRQEVWYNADEAIAAKLADRKASGNSAENSFDLSIFNYAGRDKAPDPIATPETSAVEGFHDLLKGVFA